MARPVVEKGMLIFRGATASFNKVENYLKGRKWEIESLHEVRFVLDHVTMAKSLPKYALVCLDHPEKQSKILPSLLAQKFDIRVIGYFEREGVNLSAQADKMGVAYVLLPPVSGPAVERIINKIRLDEERAAQNQQKASRKKGAAAAGGGDDVIQIRERKKESENPLANAKPESIKFKEAEPEVNPDGTPKKSSLIFMERNVGKEKSTTQEAPVPSESNLWNEDFAPPPERPAPEAVAAAAAAVAEKVAEEERLKRESALEAFDIFHETDAEKSKNAPKEAEAAGGPRSNAFDPNSPRGAPKTANFPFAPVLAPAPVEAKKAVDPLDVFNDSEPAPASSAYQPAVEPNSSPDEGASPEERARALAKLRAAMGKAAKNSDPGNPATTDEDAGKDAGKAGAATAENAAADDLAAPLVDLAKDFAGESEAAREARANREAAEAAKETAQQRDRALAKLRAKIAKPSDRAADESDDVDAEREAGESAAKKKREETEKKSRGESAQETFERAAALAEAQAEQTAAEDRARAEEKALTEEMSQAAEVSRRAEIGNTSEPTASAGLDQSEPAPHATAAKAGATAPPTPENELGLGALDPGLASAQSDIESGPESGSEFDSESKSGSDQNLLTPEITGGALAVAEAASSRALPAAPEENGRADDAAAAFADSALQEAVASAASPDANPAAQVSVAPARAEAEVATVTSAGAIKTADAQIDSSTPPVGLTAGVAPAGDIATAPATALAPDRPSIRVTRLETEIRRGFWTWILASFLRFWRRAPSARVRTGPVEIPLRLALEKCVSDWAASAEPPGEAGLHSIAPTSAWFEIDSHIFSGHLIATPTNEPSARLATEQMLARLREELGRELQSFGGEPRTGSVRAMKLDPVDWSQWLPAAAAVQATVRIDATLSFELGLIPFSQDERATNRQTFDQETYQPFFLEELKVNEPLDFDVFLHLPKNEKFVRYLKRGRVLKLPEKQKLLDRGAHQVHLRFGDEISLAAFRARRRLNQSIAQSIADTVANSEKRSGAKTEINPVAKIS